MYYVCMYLMYNNIVNVLFPCVTYNIYIRGGNSRQTSDISDMKMKIVGSLKL